MRAANLLRLATCILLLFGLVVQASALSEAYWVQGQITSTVVENWYDVTRYYEFNFTIHASNNTVYQQTTPTITVIMNTSLLSSAPLKDAFYNFTGNINDVAVGEIPVGVFVVSAFNQPPSQDWLSYLRQLIVIFSGVTRGIAEGIAQLITMATGYVIPSWAITLAITGLLAWFVIKNWKTLSLVLVVILGYVFVSGGANLLRTFFWGS